MATKKAAQTSGQVVHTIRWKQYHTSSDDWYEISVLFDLLCIVLFLLLTADLTVFLLKPCKYQDLKGR